LGRNPEREVVLSPCGIKLLDAVVEPQPRNAEHEIIEYLYRHRYDLPPEVWIELERRHLGP
jgi:hypothetical protein